MALKPSFSNIINHLRGDHAWWRHQRETFSVLLAICAWNSPVPGEFPAQRPVTRSFDVFFDLRLNKRWRKQSWGWWFETPSWSLWRHCNGMNGMGLSVWMAFVTFHIVASLYILPNCHDNLPFDNNKHPSLGPKPCHPDIAHEPGCYFIAFKGLNSPWPSDVYMQKLSRSILFQIMAWCIFSAKPFSAPMLAYC